MIALPTIIGRVGAWRQMAKPIRVVGNIAEYYSRAATRHERALEPA
jgi:hypothetical protein